MPGMKGSLLAVLAGLFWGVGEFFTRQVLHTHRVGPITAIAVRSTVALPVLWAAYLLFVHGRGGEPTDWMQAGPATLLKLVLGSGLMAGAAGMLCFYGALNLAPVSKVKPIAFALAPVVGTLLGWLLLHERMPATKWVALVLIVAGVVLLTREA
jgi:transporter family protein